jgi:uncharacterized membrane-anchored protein YhcB (DUF1043 family)
VFSPLAFWLTVIAAFAAGTGLGIFAAPLLKRARPGRSDPLHELRELQEQQAHYRNQVTEHFSQSADLLARLAENYRDVHNHLARGAQTLCEPNELSALEPLGEPSRPAPRPTLIEQPRDYAPRSGTGTLAEDFGLDKRRAPETVEPPRY